MCNIKQYREPPQYEGKTWTWINGQRVRVVFTDEARPAEPHIVIERSNFQPLPPSKGMLTFVAYLRAKHGLGCA